MENFEDKLKSLITKDKVEGTSLSALKRKTTHGKSGLKGVSFYEPTKKWRAYIQFKGKLKHLGYFDSKEEAIKVRREAEELVFKPVLEKYKKD